MFSFLFCSDETLTKSSFSEITGHHRGKSGQEIKQELKESRRNSTCCLLTVWRLVCFLLEPRPASQGMVPPIVGGALLDQLLMKEIPERQDQRPV